MLDLRLRDEFRGKKLKGTTVDFTNQSKTGALEVPASEFLRITYPSFDLLKTIDSIGPDQSRPVVLMGARGQGKSHLLAALYHLCTNHAAGKAWLGEWSERLGPVCAHHPGESVTSSGGSANFGPARQIPALSVIVRMIDHRINKLGRNAGSRTPT